MDVPNPDLHDQDESVRIAVSALGDMRNSTQQGRTDTVSSTSDINLPFVSRIPLVNTAIRAYEHGKASSRVVKYSAEMMESSVKTISRPVIDRLPVNVNQLDEFASRQLDRLDRYRRPSSGENTTPTSPNTSYNPNNTSPPESQIPGRPKIKLKSKTLDGSAVEETETENRGLGKDWQDNKNKEGTPIWLRTDSPFIGPPPPPPELTPTAPTQQPSEERQVAQRSRWQAMLLEAGGLSAALSEESMRRLKYCLQWLQYATAHIDAQILILRDFTASLQPASSSSHARNAHPPVSPARMRTLTNVRRDIVHTIRQVVEVVSRYAGGALPEPARGRVRGFILELPQRWARKAGCKPGSSARNSDVDRERDKERDRERERGAVAAAAAGGGTGAVRRGNRRAAAAGHRERGAGASTGSTPSSRAASPMARRHQEENGEPVPAGTAIITAQRILTLATESLDMMRGVTGVVKDSLDRADAWVNRLRTVGIQRGAAQQNGEEPSSPTSPSTITPTANGSHNPKPDSPTGLELDIEHMRHRRADSSGSQFEDGEWMPSPYSGASSYAGGSSVPSTPSVGTYTPGYGYAQGGGAVLGGSYAGNAPSPGIMGLGLGSMSLGGSRFSTPRSVAGGLPDEDDGMEKGRMMESANMKEEPTDDVKIVGMDVEVEGGGAEGKGAGHGKMDVDS